MKKKGRTVRVLVKGRTVRVLVVDDNDAYREGLVEFLLGLRGVDVVGEAGGGSQAVYMARTLNPDLILMDISMPGTNGLEAAREIKQLSPRTKVVFVTVHREETYRALSELLGADGFITKSSVKEGLEKIIQDMRFGIGTSQDFLHLGRSHV